MGKTKRHSFEKCYWVFNDRLSPIKIYDKEDYQNWVHRKTGNRFQTKKEVEEFIKRIKNLLLLK